MLKRTHGIIIRLSDTELAALNSKVKKTGLSRESYCRKILKGAKVIEAPDIDTQHLIHELRALRSDLEVLLCAGDASMMPSISDVMERAMEAENEIVRTFKGRAE